MDKRHELVALFNDFDAARKAIVALKALAPHGDTAAQLRLISPIPHPELEELIGPHPVPVRRFALIGAALGAIAGFVLAAGYGEAMFTVQPQGGKPVVPLPPNIVIMYELTILFGVWSTLLGFLFGARLPTLRSRLYTPRVSEDQVGLQVEVPAPDYPRVKELLQRHHAVELMEHS